MTSMSKGVKFCLTINAIGLAIYLVVCWRLWAGMPDGRIDADDGPSFISFGLMALPFLAACALFNVVVFVRAVRNVFIGKGWGLLTAWAIVVASWLIGYLWARSHMGG